MKRKLTTLILIFTLALLAFCSCENIFPQPGGEPINPSGNTKGEYTQVVCEHLEFDFTDLRYEYQELKGGLIATVTDSEPVRDREITIGETNRAITAAAKAELNSEIAKSSKYDSGYIIYAQDGCVGVYWTVPDMSDIAISDFVNKCIVKDKLILKEGTLVVELFDKREFETEKYWIALEKETTPDVIAALKEMHAYYDGSRIVEWLANLYDPVSGGIYYSRSARDNVPFLPDIESTAQAISFLINNKAIANRNVLPNDLKIKFIEFAKGLQSPVDGYFYHPQWPQSRDELAVDRYGRDIGWSTTTITEFLADYDDDGEYDPQYPNWCAPNGTKCALHQNGGKCSFPQATAYYTSAFESGVSVALSTSHTDAVSRLPRSSVEPVATVSSKPDYSSAAAFSTWLESYNETVKENSGRAHQLAAIKGEIKSHGYLDIVLDHLDRVQKEVYDEQMQLGETPTGLWQKNVDYKAVWGLLKYMSFYNESGYQRKIDIKYVPHIINTCIKVIEMPADGDYASNDLYNQWSGISNLISNVKRFYGESGVRQIYSMMQQNTASLISNSLDKIEPFKMEDGSFSARSNGMTSANIYSSHIALGVSEGNVNSTGLICSMYRSIYSCLGLPLVPLCNSDDGELFIRTVKELPPIEKNETDSGVIKFDNGQLPSSINTKFNNADSGAQAIVVPDPTDNVNNVLYFASVAGTVGGDTITFDTQGAGTSCYVYECDFYVTSDSADKIIMQSKMHNSYMIMFTKDGNKIRITDNATTSATGKYYTNIAEVETDKWFTVRIEYYLNGEEQNALDVPKIKVFINGEYVLTSENFYGSHESGAVPKNKFDEVTVFSPKATTSYMYLDNCYFAAIDKEYVAEED